MGDGPSGSYTGSGCGGTRTKASALVEHEANIVTGTKTTSPLLEGMSSYRMMVSPRYHGPSLVGRWSPLDYAGRIAVPNPVMDPSCDTGYHT